MKKFSILIIAAIFVMAGSIAFTEINKPGIGKDIQSRLVQLVITVNATVKFGKYQELMHANKIYV